MAKQIHKYKAYDKVVCQESVIGRERPLPVKFQVLTIKNFKIQNGICYFCFYEYHESGEDVESQTYFRGDLFFPLNLYSEIEQHELILFHFQLN